MNMTLDELKARAKADLDNAFEKGKSQGGGDITQNPFYYLVDGNAIWQGATFPDEFDFALELKNVPNSVNGMLMRATGVKTISLICNAEGTTNFNQMIRENSAEVLDLSKFKPTPSSINYFAYGNKTIVTITGELDLSSCTSASFPFSNAISLVEIRLKKGSTSIALDFKSCTKLSAQSLHSIIEGLSDESSGKTLTLPAHATVKATYDAKYGEGAWDILAASKTNWTIAYS